MLYRSPVLRHALTRTLFCQVNSANASLRILSAVARRVPSGGMPAGKLQALLSEEFPSFTPATVGALTLKEALQRFPQLFTIEGGRQGGPWWVRHASPAAAASSSPSSASGTVQASSNNNNGGGSDSRGCDGDSRSSHTGASVVKRELVIQKIHQYCINASKRTLSSRANMAGSGSDGVRSDFLPLEEVLVGCGERDVNAVDAVMSPEAQMAGLEVKVDIEIKPKRTARRSAIVFIDGDELSPAAVEAMYDALSLDRDTSSTRVVRGANSIPLSEVDVVCPAGVPTYLGIEMHAKSLSIREEVVLKDVVYMCSTRQFHSYTENVSLLNKFPDADVYVCCPEKIRVTQPKKVILF